jgi:hypothetical protein
MRLVRILEDVVTQKLTVYYKERSFWSWGWKEDRSVYYASTDITREEAWTLVKQRAEALEKEKIVYETPRPVYYP